MSGKRGCLRAAASRDTPRQGRPAPLPEFTWSWRSLLLGLLVTDHVETADQRSYAHTCPSRTSSAAAWELRRGVRPPIRPRRDACPVVGFTITDPTTADTVPLASSRGSL